MTDNEIDNVMRSFFFFFLLAIDLQSCLCINIVIDGFTFGSKMVIERVKKCLYIENNVQNKIKKIYTHMKAFFEQK